MSHSEHASIIHPVATGAAGCTVAEHQKPQDVVFYSGWFCPFAQRTWLVLEEKGIPYQYVETNPYAKDPEYLKICPKGLVPSIGYDSRIISDSHILNEFLEDAFSPSPASSPASSRHSDSGSDSELPSPTSSTSSTSSLWPAHPADRALARSAIDHINHKIILSNFKLIQSQSAEDQDAARAEVTAALRSFAEDIKGPWYFGDEISLVDLSIAPWVERDWVVRDYRGFKREDVGEKWVEYAGRLQNRESVVKTTSLRERLEPIYLNLLGDKVQNEVSKAVKARKASSSWDEKEPKAQKVDH